MRLFLVIVGWYLVGWLVAAIMDTFAPTLSRRARWWTFATVVAVLYVCAPANVTPRW